MFTNETYFKNLIRSNFYKFYLLLKAIHIYFVKFIGKI